MKLRDIVYWLRFGAITIISAAATVVFLNVAAAFAADVSPDSLKFAPGVVKAPAYETPATSYIVANPPVSSAITTSLKQKPPGGEKIEALAKVKDWDWVLVGKNGTGIGYVAISMLAPADKYIP